MIRRKTHSFQIRDLGIGSDYPIFVQSMTNTDTHDVSRTLAQIESLAQAGAKLVRIAILDQHAVPSAAEIARKSTVPIVADIHFDYRLALACISAGLDALRINPGNIGGTDRFLEVLKMAKAAKTPIRIGVNSGSVDKDVLKKHGHLSAAAMVESLEQYVRVAESIGMEDLALSVKASDVVTMIEANRLAAKKLPYPLHLGVTEAGSVQRGTVKSAVGVGALLAEGIGDTIRISLTGDPMNELPVAYEILKALHLADRGPVIVACPTCGRTQIQLESLLHDVEEICDDITAPLKVAVMGCAVNGPGEAREADIGIAGGKAFGIVFRKGEIVARVPEEALIETFKKELNKLLTEEYK